MKTKPLYLEDSYLKVMDAVIVDVLLEAEGEWRIILDQTVFYPMGGGQPTDQGVFLFPDCSKIEVGKVLLKDGEINHYVKMPSQPVIGSKIQGLIDWDRRYKNMKVHSGGHVIDFAMYLLGYSPKTLSPLKGDHGKKPFIIYSGTLGKEIQKELERKANELVGKGLSFSWSFEMLENIQKEALYLQPGLPINKPLRALRLEGVGVVADGGTIVKSTREVGQISILAIEEESGETTNSVCDSKLIVF